MSNEAEGQEHLSFDNKEDAEKYRRAISRNQGTELVIHGESGRIYHSGSNGNDPYPPKG